MRDKIDIGVFFFEMFLFVCKINCKFADWKIIKT
jgi:hypothetical protein